MWKWKQTHTIFKSILDPGYLKRLDKRKKTHCCRAQSIVVSKPGSTPVAWQKPRQASARRPPASCERLQSRRAASHTRHGAPRAALGGGGVGYKGFRVEAHGQANLNTQRHNTQPGALRAACRGGGGGLGYKGFGVRVSKSGSRSGRSQYADSHAPQWRSSCSLRRVSCFRVSV